MSKDFKNVLYLVLISALCIIVPFFAPAISPLFYSLPLAFIVLAFFSTRFAGASLWSSLAASILIFAYASFGERLWAQFIRPGLFNSVAVVLLIAGVVFVVECLVSGSAKKAIGVATKSLGWLVLGFLINMLLSLFLPAALLMGR